ncbi:hypothetical protein K435DRAFT_869213 [Dendrothele bispora CBS 962.96]|uniref:Uncharacterized protein n=1 Tax=Dendrothele bispora (strain CBS 962.96) TaxID=1314807 RepID=A0A4S8L9M2_DENBC|nr:hypothetical protein K435DRAFT_869213 [Dendrothele bispora CBS 962.96]
MVPPKTADGQQLLAHTLTFQAPIYNLKQRDDHVVNGRGIEINGHGQYQENIYRPEVDENMPNPVKTAFEKDFRPTAIKIAGSSNEPWVNLGQNELQRIWSEVMPSDFKGHYKRFERAVNTSVEEILKKWRDSFGNKAIKALESIFQEQGLVDADKQNEYITQQTGTTNTISRRPYYFAGTDDKGKPAGSFQAYIVAATLSEHFRAIQGLPADHNYQPSGALILTIFAIEKTFDDHLRGKDKTDTRSVGDLLKDGNNPTVRKIKMLTGTSRTGQKLIPDDLWSKIIRTARSHNPLDPNVTEEEVEEDIDEFPI